MFGLDFFGWFVLNGISALVSAEHDFRYMVTFTVRIATSNETVYKRDGPYKLGPNPSAPEMRFVPERVFPQQREVVDLQTDIRLGPQAISEMKPQHKGADSQPATRWDELAAV